MSRLTFREKAGAVCWQKQLRDRYLAEGVPPVPHLDVKRAMVRPVTRAQAEQVILKYEWLGTMSTTSKHFGIFFGNYCAGVTCVAVGAAMAGAGHHVQFGIQRNELLTLARGACVHWAPPGTNSRLIAITCRLLRRAGLGRLIWATSDSDAGEVGTIYQAAGWVYIGQTVDRRRDAQWTAPNGRTVDKRNIGSWAKRRDTTYSAIKTQVMSAGWKPQPANPKHRYVYVLDRADTRLVARVESMRQPYPKRERSRENAAAGPPAEGGVIPTRSLQSPALTMGGERD